MKKILTALAALGLVAFAAPAFADSPNGPGRTFGPEETARLQKRVSKMLASIHARVERLAANDNVPPQVVARQRAYEARVDAVTSQVFADGVVTKAERVELRKATSRGRHLGLAIRAQGRAHGQQVALEHRAQAARPSEARQEAREAHEAAREARQNAREARQDARQAQRAAHRATAAANDADDQ